MMSNDTTPKYSPPCFRCKVIGMCFGCMKAKFTDLEVTGYYSSGELECQIKNSLNEIKITDEYGGCVFCGGNIIVRMLMPNLWGDKDKIEYRWSQKSTNPNQLRTKLRL